MKKLLALALAFAVVCGGIIFAGGSSDKKASGRKSSSETIELTVWESAGQSSMFIQKAGEAFTALHPNITIKSVSVELGDSTNQITLDGPAGIGPDVFAAPHDKLGELVAGGHILPTSNPQAIADAVLASCSKALTYDDVMYGYPVSAETYALFYNRAMISDSEVPKTWEEMRDFALKFNAANPGKHAFVMDTGNAYYTIIFTTAHGNRLFGPSGTDTSSTYLNTEAAIEGMTFFQSLRPALDAPAADLATPIVDGAFVSGNAAMHITGTWNVVMFTDAGLDFGITTLPSLPGDTVPASSFSGTRAMFVSAYSKHPEEADAFAAFLISPEMQSLRFEITEALPAIDITVDSQYIEGFLEQLEYAFPMPSIPEMGAFWDVLGAASSNIWDGADVANELNAADAAILSR